MSLLDLISPRNQSADTCVVATGYWGSELKFFVRKELRRGDHHFIVVQFANGSQARTIRLYTEKEAMIKVEQITDRIKTKDFTRYNELGQREWMTF